MTRQPSVLLILLIAMVAHSHADEPRYVVENGVTYREVRGVEKRPVAETYLEDRTQTVYRTEFETELREETRTIWVPITEYISEPRWLNWWNPFAEATVTYQLRPVVRWERRNETVQVPVTVQKVIPETKIVQVPVRTLGFAESEFVQRVAVNPETSSSAFRSPAPLRR